MHFSTFSGFKNDKEWRCTLKVDTRIRSDYYLKDIY